MISITPKEMEKKVEGHSLSGQLRQLARPNHPTCSPIDLDNVGAQVGCLSQPKRGAAQMREWYIAAQQEHPLSVK